MKALRAVSPVVATALLVLIAVATAVLLYLWVSGTVTNTSTSNPTLTERIKIDAVSYDSANSKVKIYVRNVGDVTVKIAAAYVINAVDGSLAGSNTTVAKDLSPGDVLEVDVSATLTSGVPYLVKVTTTDGVEATTTFVVKS